MKSGKLLYFHYTILEEELPKYFTPADMNYLFGMEACCDIVFPDPLLLDFEIISLGPDENDYLRGVDISMRRKLDEMGILYSVRSDYYE